MVNPLDDSQITAKSRSSEEPRTPLILRLQQKLADLEARGLPVLWIEASAARLVQLFMEGGDQVIQLDPDPAVDKAWFSAYEIRPGLEPVMWIYVSGEYDGVSRHEA